MADTAFHDPGVELVARASVPATEYAQYKAIRDKFKREALGQLEQAIRASTVMALDGLPYPVKFRNQGALDEWERLFRAHEWSQRMWDTWTTPRATCLDCINELCWQIDQHLHPHPRSQRPPDWPDAGFATVVRWAANIHFERKCGALIETTPAPILIHADRLSGQAPPPKVYGLTTDRAWPSRAACGQQQTKQRIQPQERA